jgi:hypothetical protein
MSHWGGGMVEKAFLDEDEMNYLGSRTLNICLSQQKMKTEGSGVCITCTLCPISC